jgi:hypothetical protein
MLDLPDSTPLTAALLAALLTGGTFQNMLPAPTADEDTDTETDNPPPLCHRPPCLLVSPTTSEGDPGDRRSCARPSNTGVGFLGVTSLGPLRPLEPEPPPLPASLLWGRVYPGVPFGDGVVAIVLGGGIYNTKGGTCS